MKLPPHAHLSAQTDSVPYRPGGRAAFYVRFEGARRHSRCTEVPLDPCHDAAERGRVERLPAVRHATPVHVGFLTRTPPYPALTATLDLVGRGGAASALRRRPVAEGGWALEAHRVQLQQSSPVALPRVRIEQAMSELASTLAHAPQGVVVRELTRIPENLQLPPRRSGSEAWRECSEIESRDCTE